MRLRTEETILASWTDSQVIVTVVCITYNQINYIEKALNSFLTQITSFRFKILIHDDASTDGTSEILKEYAIKYPQLFEVVIQNENQYSQGRLLSVGNLWSLVESEYIAFCEGDDFWLDPHKLEKQLEAITPDIDLCFHAAMKVSEDGHNLKPMSLYTKSKYELTDVVPCGGGFIPTASWFVRTEALLELPTWLTSLPFTDYFIQIWVMRQGGAIYIPEIMSAYRTGAVGSSVDAYSTVKKKLIYCDAMFLGLNKLDDALDQRYSKEIATRKKSILISHIKFFTKRFSFLELIKLVIKYFR
jgi:glycosyltransferase involved in cell wall biosynthesis